MDLQHFDFSLKLPSEKIPFGIISTQTTITALLATISQQLSEVISSQTSEPLENVMARFEKLTGEVEHVIGKEILVKYGQ